MKYNGNKISLNIVGESHTNSIELKIKGFAKGAKLSFDEIKQELKRRNPQYFFNTQRKEEDDFEIIKGIKKDGTICSKEIAVSFKNNSFNSKPYEDNMGFLRPSHSDYACYLKNGTTKAGGGEFSGRMTLPICFAGSIAKQLLKKEGISVCSRIKSIYNLEDEELDIEKIKTLNPTFPVQNQEFGARAFDLLKEARRERDSMGGVVEMAVFGVKAGFGDAMFESLEGKISQAVFGIPAVKGVAFGDGFDITKLKGSEAQDEFYCEDSKILTKRNHNGGINGGVTNGMPIILKVAIKPVPTIGQPMKSYNVVTKKEEKVTFEGNHDLFLVNRAIPALEGVVALTLLDLYYEKN